MATGVSETAESPYYPSVTVLDQARSVNADVTNGPNPGMLEDTTEQAEDEILSIPHSSNKPRRQPPLLNKSTDCRNKLTVCEESKVETELKARRERQHGTPCLNVLLRWVVTMLVCAAFLVCLTCSKLSLIHLSNNLLLNRLNNSHDNSSSLYDAAKKKTDHFGCESDFLMLLILLMIPYALTLLRAIWCGGFRGDRPWPSLWELLAVVVCSFLECAGISLFSLEVISRSPSYISILLMNGVFLVSIFHQLVQCLREGLTHRRNKMLFIAFLFALILEVTGITLSAIELSPQSQNNITTLWEIPISLLCLSIAWCPALQKAQMQMTVRKTAKTERSSTQSPEPESVFSDEQVFDNPSEITSERMDCAEEKENIDSHGKSSNARWKSSMIGNTLKLILLPSFCLLYGHFLDMIDITNLDSGLSNVNSKHPVFGAFLINIFSSFIGYILGWMACTMCMWRAGFALPLTLATPVALLIVFLEHSCKFFLGTTAIDCPTIDSHNLAYTLPAALCLYLAQILSTGYFVFKTHTIIMQQESQIFWLPGYNGIFLEQWLLLSRKNIATDRMPDPREMARKMRVYICTTMYREEPREMEQLLQSISRVNCATQESDRQFQSHVFFDNGVRGQKLTHFALQLISIAKKTLGITVEECTKVLTPYGMKLTWQLPSIGEGKEGIHFLIHLKDNHKVKNKKRWSQVMYMSYVLDFFIKEDRCADQDTYILTTDADVKFGPESVEALLDLMTRDERVGAVCARTHPMGSGPIVWYQIFEYAIGHWLQKAANHVLGSVLCCPGCFSVYRAEAVRDILPAYSSNVLQASEFLTKDMGEDRWLCTLMVQNGWRLEYCAAAEDSTYCPEEFEEFFKQRRRWIPSTMANQQLVLREWQSIWHFNKGISFFFLIYQAMLLFSSLINPSVCLLIIVGGLYYAWQVSQILSTLTLITVSVGYALICLYASQEKQLMVAKFLTVGFALIMAAVTLGTVLQIADDLTPDKVPGTTTVGPPSTLPPNKTYLANRLQPAMRHLMESADTLTNHIDSPPTTSEPTDEEIALPLSVSTLYLAGLAGIFLVTAIMHLPEAYCLIHGFWYLLCLPAGNLLLIIYSICNLTDRSWGTREEKKLGNFQKNESWFDTWRITFKKICFCCMEDEDKKPTPTSSTATQTRHEPMSPADTEEEPSETERCSSLKERRDSRKSLQRGHSLRFHSDGADAENIPVSSWLPADLKHKYADMFTTCGYDDTSFLSGMSDSELREVGVSSKAHRDALIKEIRRLPDPEIDPAVPEKPLVWLETIGLPMYKTNFKDSHILTSSNMETLKGLSKAEIRNELRITKPGHLKRIILAIDKLRYPSAIEREISDVKYEMNALPGHSLKDINLSEYTFWERLRQECLRPDSVAFAYDHELKEKLTELRNSTVMVFAITNAIWLILISTLVTKSELNVLGTNILGLAFLVIFGLLLCIQFLCMIVHRIATWMHLIARAPGKCGDPYRAAWSFKDSNVPTTEESSLYLVDSGDIEAARTKESYNNRIKEKYRQDVNRRKLRGMASPRNRSTDDEREQLLASENSIRSYRSLPR